MDIGVFARLHYVLLGDVLEAAKTQENVFADSALVESWLLRDQRNHFAVVLDVELGYVAAVDEDLAREGVVKALEEADGGGFSTPGWADECDILSLVLVSGVFVLREGGGGTNRLYREVEAA